jgi:AraC-like DNA-binding protein
MSWVQTVLAEAQRQGLPEAALLDAAGIPRRDLRLDRWPVDHITRLWRTAARLTQDAGFGLKAGAAVGPASFNVVGFILQSARTLRQALAVAQKYQGLISDGGRLQLLAAADASWLIYHPQQGDLAFSPHQIEAVLAAIVCASRWLAPRPLRPRLACFGHAAVGPLAGYRAVLGCRVDFNQAFSGLLIDNALLDQPLPQADARLAAVHERHAADRLAALAAGPQLDERLRQWLAARLGPELPARAEAAAAFGLGERTLARRLVERGTTYATLLDELRRERALQHLAQGGALRTLAHDLGYADPRCLHRSFLRWTGCTPGQWRQRAAAEALPMASRPAPPSRLDGAWRGGLTKGG